MENTLEQQKASERDSIFSEIKRGKEEIKRLEVVGKELSDKNKELSVKVAEVDKILFEKNALLFDIPKIKSEVAGLNFTKKALNEEILTLQEKAQLNTWVEQRDKIAKEVSDLQIAREKLTKTNKELSESSFELTKNVSALQGKMAELDKLEKDYENIASEDIKKALIEKTRLQGETTALKGEVLLLEARKKGIMESVNTLETLHTKIFNQVGVLDKVVDHVTRISDDNSNKIEKMVTDLKDSLQKIIDINNKNVADAKMVGDQLPRLFFDLQRKGLETYKLNKVKKQ